jgi:aminopeptidase N
MFKNTNPGHLFAAIDFEAQKAGVLPGVSFKDIASSWTEQPGVPVVTATRDYYSNIVTLNQERFFYSPPNRRTLLQQRWHIPVTIVAQDSADWDDTKPTAWLSPDIEDVAVAVNADTSQWVLVNPKEIGQY